MGASGLSRQDMSYVHICRDKCSRSTATNVGQACCRSCMHLAAARAATHQACLRTHTGPAPTGTCAVSSPIKLSFCQHGSVPKPCASSTSQHQGPRSMMLIELVHGPSFARRLLEGRPAELSRTSSGMCTAVTSSYSDLDPGSLRADLEVHLGVPVAVEQHHHVCGVQVDTQPPGSSGQQEDELLAALPVVLLDLALPVLSAGVACTQPNSGFEAGVACISFCSCS